MNQLLVYLKADTNLASAIAAIFSALTAFIALVLSVISIWIQRRHNVVSVRPVPEVTVADYENSLRIKLRNNGFGPLIIKSIRVVKNSESKESVIDWMPKLPIGRAWTHFSTKLQNRTLEPNGVIVLLELTEIQNEYDFSTIRDLIRRELFALVVEVEYSDVYGSRYKKYTKRMAWFGRNVGLYDEADS